MIPKTALLAIVVVGTGCAARNANSGTLVLREQAPGIYLGHSDSGDVILATSHYAAMNGLAVTDTDLGLQRRKSSDGAMLCQREVLTGSHVPHWTCRYVEDVEMQQKMTLNAFTSPVFAPNAAIRGAAIFTTALAGPANRTQPQ